MRIVQFLGCASQVDLEAVPLAPASVLVQFSVFSVFPVREEADGGRVVELLQVAVCKVVCKLRGAKGRKGREPDRFLVGAPVPVGDVVQDPRCEGAVHPRLLQLLPLKEHGLTCVGVHWRNLKTRFSQCFQAREASLEWTHPPRCRVGRRAEVGPSMGFPQGGNGQEPSSPRPGFLHILTNGFPRLFHDFKPSFHDQTEISV